MKALMLTTLRPPFARYAHGVEISAGCCIVQTAGQLEIRNDDSIPSGAYEQAIICFHNIAEILCTGEMGPVEVAHVAAYVTERDHMAYYMKARNEFLAGTQHLPSSTLLIVSDFTRPEFKVEVETLAAAP